jgi:hypothetical protein
MAGMTLYRTTYHRDGTVTLWHVYRQAWVRLHVRDISDDTLATLSHTERRRIETMRGRLDRLRRTA